MEEDYCSPREAETVDTRPIAFRIEINEEHRRYFIEHAKHCGLVSCLSFIITVITVSFFQDKFNVAEDYLSTDDEEEHAAGDARNELKRAGSNFDGVELKSYRTKVRAFQFQKSHYFSVKNSWNITTSTTQKI